MKIIQKTKKKMMVQSKILAGTLLFLKAGFLTFSADIITLTSNGTDVPPPNDKFLFLHFRIAEILAVSGVGEKIEAALNESCLDIDNIRPDGSTDIESILSGKMLMIIQWVGTSDVSLSLIETGASEELDPVDQDTLPRGVGGAVH
jgi:hypothetical protein